MSDIKRMIRAVIQKMAKPCPHCSLLISAEVNMSHSTRAERLVLADLSARGAIRFVSTEDAMVKMTNSVNKMNPALIKEQYEKVFKE